VRSVVGAVEVLREEVRATGGREQVLGEGLSSPRASAPPTISMISVVMASWRAWFISRVSLMMSSSALSVAAFMARWRAACSEAAASSSAE
jgi:hypothetical protein